ncbi:DUF4261 domain-containing protein [Brachyspira pulli]|uniref:DUF4261 domain-containing protein n=1 Tax=Brachyspira pulli TaxID=310721 RepID=UPI0030079A71
MRDKKEVNPNPNHKSTNHDEANFSHVYFYKLLFEEKPTLPNIELVKQKIRKFYDDIDVVSSDNGIYSIAINDLKVKYQDEKEVPAQILMPDAMEFDYTSISDYYYSQMWDIKEPKELIKNCNYEIMLSDFLAAGLDYKERTTLLNNWLYISLQLFNNCVAVYNEQSGKLLLPEQILNNNYPKDFRFLLSGVNIRLFNVQDSKDVIVDTLGMYAIGLPDIQYHFHDLNVNEIISHALNIAAYIFDKGDIIKSGDTIQSIFENVQWKCQYEKSLLKPHREILDINTLEYASGKREENKTN